MKCFKPQKPQPQMWTTVHVGNSRYYISLTVSIQNRIIGVEFYIPDDKKIGQKAIDNLSMFEETVGVEGKTFMANKASGIRFFLPNADITNEQNWDSYIDWQTDKAIKLRDAIHQLEI